MTNKTQRTSRGLPVRSSVRAGHHVYYAPAPTVHGTARRTARRTSRRHEMYD